MYNDEELEKVEKEENSFTEEALVLMLASISSTKAELEKELRLFYQKYGKDGVMTYSEARKWISDKNHQRRLTWLLVFIGTLFSDLFGNLRSDFDSLVSKVIKKEYDFFGVSLETPKLNWGVDDLTWLDRLADDMTMWEAYVVNDIKRSMLAKKPIDDILELLDKRFMTMENIIRNLAITETTAVGSIARQQAFKELGITKYQYFAREDERTCEYCGSLHGLVFPISAYEVGVTASPIHPRCRCWEVPIRE